MSSVPARMLFVPCVALLMAALAPLAARCAEPSAAGNSAEASISVSGIYPHLASFNNGGECGIGAVVPWAGRLWWVTYPPHARNGSPDKLYSIDDKLQLTIHPESVGGTHPGRMIHRESNQLLIGPYAIDAKGRVRAFNVKNALNARITAYARHLVDPANKVYILDMEGPVWEADVHTLAVKKLFEKPVPGWHCKGAYTGHGRLVIANNGELPVWNNVDRAKAEFDFSVAAGPEDKGVLAEWDGQKWNVVERRQYTEVTGPGGIEGNAKASDPVWSFGWDRRSALLKLLDGGKWHTFRLPKASVTYDHEGGWYTEWPRIREVAANRMLMDSHGMFYQFPKSFSAANSGGIRPIASHLRMVPDFCGWNGKLVLASDDTSVLWGNPMAGQSQSNLWFGKWDDLSSFGPRMAWGGPWLHDQIKAGVPSDPCLASGFDNRVVHIANYGKEDIVVTFEFDADGSGLWQKNRDVPVPAGGYSYRILLTDFRAEWMRFFADKDSEVSLMFHFSSPWPDAEEHKAMFASLADVTYDRPVCSAILRPAKENRNLQVLSRSADSSGALAEKYLEVDADLKFIAAPDRAEEVRKLCKVEPQFEVDAASVIMIRDGKRYRLPKGDARYDRPFAGGIPRCIRECVTERTLVNAHGTFYLLGKESGMPWLQPVCSHGKQIMDFCTWRGLLAMSGTRADAKPDKHYFGNGEAGLWFGSIDDLWKLGKPVGHGGPWKNSHVEAGVPSDPYLMTGFDSKSISLSHDAKKDVAITMEIDIDHSGWHRYESFNIRPGQTVRHIMPDGYQAHWLRVTSDTTCTATMECNYQ